MKFSPKYTITNQLLTNIKRVNSLVIELNSKNLTKVILLELERKAREVSSHASTSIEGNPLPLTEVKKILKSAPKNARQSEQEVLNYNTALKALNIILRQKSPPISKNLILEIHKKVVSSLLPDYQSGHFRKEPVVVHNPRTGQIVYLPPDAKDVESMMDSLINFVVEKRNEIDPLIIAGIFHKEFVIIHPFIDGNGRTCRLATKVLLAMMGLNTFNLFSFENYYNNNVTNYFENVGVTGNFYDISEKINFTSWLEYFTGGIIDELLRVQKIISAKLKSEIRLEAHHKKIIELIKKNGLTSDKEYARITKRARSTRALDFKKLTEFGVIEKKDKGKATYYKLKST